MKFLKLSFLIFLSFQNLFASVSPEVILQTIEKGDFETAKNDFSTLKNYSTELSLFLAYRLENDGEKAKNFLLEFLKKYPNSKFAEQTQFDLIYYFYTIKDFGSAKKETAVFLEKFPNSEFAKLIDNVNQVVTEVSKFSIQVGAFESEINAKKLQSMLTAKGYNALVQEKNINSQKLNIVLVNEESGSRNEAVRLGKQILADFPEIKTFKLIEN
ncbi:SPOR domain-containing protein [bacterium]|nr:SPOR domain-containing protein [bacterium]